MSSRESTRIEDCSKVVFVAALSQEVPIEKKDKYQSDDASYDTSHNGPNVRTLRLDDREGANSNNRARLEYRGNSEHSRMSCLAVGCY